MTSIFVTATDTDAGKTFISCALLTLLAEHGLTAAALKPISAGAEPSATGLINEDAKLLSLSVNSKQSIQEINPIVFEQAIAPHIAATLKGETLSVARVNEVYHRFQHNDCSDISLIEGAGGWLLPLNDKETLAEFVSLQKLPVLLVVDMKLGCLNHAMLTYNAILDAGLSCIGWIANGYRQMPYEDENFSFLTSKINAPCLGRLGYVESVNEATQYLTIEPLLALLT